MHLRTVLLMEWIIMSLRRLGWLAKQLLLALRGNRTGAAQEFQFSPPHPDPDPPSHLDLLRRGIGQWNAWRAQHPALQPDLGGVNLQGVNLCGANLSDANLQGADLSGSRLSGVNLCGAHLEGANLSRAYLAGQRAETVELPPANLRRAFFDYATNLEGIVFGDATGGAVLLADVHWNNVNLTVVDWSSLTVIGDDREADRCKHISRYRRAARANHQLSVALQDQGLAKEATSFAYQACVRQRQVLRLQALMRPASSPQQRWLVHLLHLWWHNP